MSSKKTERKHLRVTIDEKVYEGYAIIEGTKQLSQIIYYPTRNLSLPDPTVYSSKETTKMKHYAETILRELVLRK